MAATRGIDADERLVATVADALRRLYDPPALLRSPLREALVPNSTPEAGVRFLRTALLEAVESLNPGPKVPFRAPASRSYDAIRLHYVEGRTIEEVARELAVSERQAYRDIRRGEADVATVLWARHRPQERELQHSAGRSLRQEVQRLQLGAGTTELQQALLEALAAVTPLAKRMGVALHAGQTGELKVSADAGGLRQCLIATLSCAIQCGCRQLGVVARPGAQTVSLRIACDGSKGRAAPPPNLRATARVLAEAIGAELEERLQGEEPYVALRLPLAAPATVLVIDDNQGLIELFQRYLQDSDCRVLGASDATEGLRLARESRPNAIVLDILMPGTDGWALLGELKADSTIAQVPVIVCSVFNDPELAKALGAAAFISKPVARAELLRALAVLGLG